MSEKGITQYQLAEQAGYTQSYISQICAGKRTPTIGALTKIGDCLGVPVQMFLQENPLSRGSAPLSDSEERMLLLYQMLSESNQATLVSLAEQMCTAQSAKRRRRKTTDK